MVLLDDKEKQRISGGAPHLMALGAASIKLLHGILTTGWVILEGINLVSDHIKVKPNPRPKLPYQDNGMTFVNQLINSRTRIDS